MIIVADTNFLLYLALYRIDAKRELERIFGSFRLVLPSQVLTELKGLKVEAVKAADRAAAKLALVLLQKWKAHKLFSIKAVKAKSADQAVAALAKRLKKEGKDVRVATLDKALISGLKKCGVRVVKIRQKRYLE